jgi:myosin-crossreactive antigen
MWCQYIELLIYPNPTSGNVNFKGTKNISEIEIYNALGQKVAHLRNNNSTQFTIDLGTDKGVYILKITLSSGSQLTKRVVVK